MLAGKWPWVATQGIVVVKGIPIGLEVQSASCASVWEAEIEIEKRKIASYIMHRMQDIVCMV